MTDFNAILQDHLQNDKDRLNRIEQKIDKLADAVISIARAEEKLIGLEQSRDSTAIRMGALEAKHEASVATLANHKQVIAGLTKLFWLVLASVVTLGFGVIVV